MRPTSSPIITVKAIIDPPNLTGSEIEDIFTNALLIILIVSAMAIKPTEVLSGTLPTNLVAAIRPTSSPSNIVIAPTLDHKEAGSTLAMLVSESHNIFKDIAIDIKGKVALEMSSNFILLKA